MPQLNAYCAGYVFKAPGFSPDVISGAAGQQMLVVGAAVGDDMTLGNHFAGFRVVAHLVGTHDVCRCSGLPPGREAYKPGRLFPAAARRRRPRFFSADNLRNFFPDPADWRSQATG